MIKFRGSRCLCFEGTKRILSLDKCPKSFGAFEKRAHVMRYLIKF